MLMGIVPDYFFSQCSFEEQFIQIIQILTQNSVVLCIYAAVFNYAAP